MNNHYMVAHTTEFLPNGFSKSIYRVYFFDYSLAAEDQMQIVVSTASESYAEDVAYSLNQARNNRQNLPN